LIHHPAAGMLCSEQEQCRVDKLLV